MGRGARGTRLVVGSRSFRLCFRSVLGEVLVDVGRVQKGLRAGDGVGSSNVRRLARPRLDDQTHPGERHGGLKGLLKRTKLRRLATRRRSETVGSMRAQLLYADDGSTNCECPNYDEDGDDYAALSSEEIYQDYVERFFRDPLDPDLVTGNTLILRKPRRHARRSPRGRDDARGDGADRAARAWRRAPDHSGD